MVKKITQPFEFMLQAKMGQQYKTNKKKYIDLNNFSAKKKKMTRVGPIQRGRNDGEINYKWSITFKNCELAILYFCNI